MMRASKTIVVTVLLLAAFAVACGTEDPTVRTADWEENFNAVNRASAAGEHDRAIATAEAFLKKHPDNVDGHLMLGSALSDAGRAASDASRPARFAQAVPHYARVLELSSNENFRFVALSSLVELHRTHGLGKPDEALRYARMLITDRPGELTSYGLALHLLQESRKYDEAAALLAQAKTALQPTAESVVSYANMAQSFAAFSPELPQAIASTVLADTVAIIEQGITKHGRTEELLRVKGTLLRNQADVEPDQARQRALLQESNRTFDELDRLAK